KIRFLALTIFFATLMLSVKISDIWDGIDGLLGGAIQVAEAQAQAQTQTNDAPAKNPEDQREDLEAAREKEDDPDANEEGDVSRLITDDPTLLSPAEIEILQQLAVRRDNLDAREAEFSAREGLFKAAEERIDKKIAELQNLRVTIDSLIKKFDAQQDAKLNSLVKIYENMKPKSAARIFEQLEMDTLLEVAERMKERKLAAIMAQLGEERAREVTVELRRLREMPKVGG
ncbi:MAG: hypothetical protein P8M79_05725, partial [Alphaproteobacteria bacterium]|nr:hypothetical protein [Alphaproteobacteria bacterium]